MAENKKSNQADAYMESMKAYQKTYIERPMIFFYTFIPYCHSFRNLRNSHCRAKLKRRFLKCLNQ